MTPAWIERKERCDRLVKPRTLHHIEKTLVIEEKDALGAGKITVSTDGEVIQLHPLNTTINWLSSDACADGAFMEAQGETVVLHIFELKSKLDSQKWAKATEQFRGMLRRARAIAAVIGLEKIDKVSCYIVYSEDVITKYISANPVLLKTGLGLRTPSTNTLAWMNKTLDIDDYKGISVIPIKRDAEGNATYSTQIA